MKLNRKSALIISYILDNILPPIIRDSKWFMHIPFKLIFKKNYKFFFEYKLKAPHLSNKEYLKTYNEVESVLIKRATCLNQKCIELIFKKIIGKSVLEVGCGEGFLANKIKQKGYNIVALDILIDSKLRQKYPGIKFKEGNVEKLPFKNKEFDTVICTHTLEHVQNLFLAINELRRVAKKCLIIVVPKQRPYKYTFDLHLHFFPYPHSLLAIMGKRSNSCEEVGGDIFYIEYVD